MTAEQGTQERSGWVVFAVAMLLVLAVLNVINGIAVVVNADWVVFNKGGAWLFDFTVWGVVSLVLGIIEALVGLGLLAGSEVARVIGIVIAIIAAVNAMFITPIYPAWGILAFVLALLIIYALTVGKSAT